MGHSLCSFILRQIPRRSPTHNAVYFTTTRLGGYSKHAKCNNVIDRHPSVACILGWRSFYTPEDLTVTFYYSCLSWLSIAYPIMGQLVIQRKSKALCLIAVIVKANGV